MKILIGLFLIVHGMIHAAYFNGPNDPNYPFLAEKSWLVTKLGMSINSFKPIMITLAAVAFIFFLLAGLSYLNFLVPAGWFKLLASVGAISSLALIILTWNNWFVVGAGIDVAILYLLFSGEWK